LILVPIQYFQWVGVQKLRYYTCEIVFSGQVDAAAKPMEPGRGPLAPELAAFIRMLDVLLAVPRQDLIVEMKKDGRHERPKPAAAVPKPSECLTLGA
jgi:hypothetical protein